MKSFAILFGGAALAYAFATTAGTGSGCCALDAAALFPAQAKAEKTIAVSACSASEHDVKADAASCSASAVLASAPAEKAGPAKATGCCAGDAVGVKASAEASKASCPASAVLASAQAASCGSSCGEKAQAASAMSDDCATACSVQVEKASLKSDGCCSTAAAAKPVRAEAAASCCAGDEVAASGAGAQAVLAAVSDGEKCGECKCDKECCDGDDCCKKKAAGTQVNVKATSCCDAAAELASAGN